MFWLVVAVATIPVAFDDDDEEEAEKSTLPCYVSCSILNNIMLRISKCHVLFCFSFTLLLLLMLGAYEWLKLFSLLSASLIQHCLTWVTVVCEWCSRSCWDCCCCVVIIIISHV